MKTQKNFKLSEESIAALKKLQVIFDDTETGVVERAIQTLSNNQNPTLESLNQIQEIVWNQIQVLQSIADHQVNGSNDFGEEYLIALQDFYERITNLKNNNLNKNN
jgi:hypothetical protein